MYSNNVSEMTVFGSMTSAPMNGSNESSGGASGVHLVTGEEGMPPYPDDLLQPIERLEKYSVSEIIFHRQVASRSILETLHEVREKEEDLQKIMTIIKRFASDSEPSVRAELIEALPHITVYFNQTNYLANEVPQTILPILQQFLTDTSTQVRKLTQNSLRDMLEQGYVGIDFLESKICPILVQLTDFSNLDDYRIEAVMTVARIIRFLGKDLTEKLFLQHFIRLCCDVSFHIRRVCSSHFGEFCTILGREITETSLLPQFSHLCEDGIWGVRKACADIFVPVSCVCSNEARRNILAPLLVGLLADQSRWVKTAAFQSLGPFISTFADPSKTGLYYNGGGVIVMDEIKDHESNDSGCSVGSGENSASSETDYCDTNCLQNDLNNLTVCENFDNRIDLSSENRNDTHFQIETESSFNTFQYWRIPIPDLNLNLNDSKSINLHISAKMDQETYAYNAKADEAESNHIMPFQSNNDGNNNKPIPLQGITISNEAVECNVQTLNFSQICIDAKEKTKILNSNVTEVLHPKPRTISPWTCWESSCATTRVNLINTDPVPPTFNPDSSPPDLSYWLELTSAQLTPEVKSYRLQMKQNIIPEQLLEYYLSMTNPINYQTIDVELNHHCAYSLPAVALTLGRKYWPCLKETYEILAADMQWKVRWTLASSLHQMALILGPEYTTRDLLPVFLNFMKDLDEVRFGILQNLAAILKLLNRSEQQGILPKISEFLKMDNSRNWRFRLTFANQLIEIAELYESSEIREYLFPISYALLKDKVSEVRLGAIRVLSTFIRRIFISSKSQHFEEIKKEIFENIKSFLCKSPKWFYRQGYVILCENLVEHQSLPYQVVINELLPELLSFVEDPVPNVRLALSRCITRTFLSYNELKTHTLINNALEQLRKDKDIDVRRYAETYVPFEDVAQ